MRKVLAILVSGLLVTLPISSFSGNTGQTAEPLAILQPDDAVPGDAVKLKELALGGNNFTTDCAYYELLLEAEDIAAAEGANILKIKKRIQHARNRPCDGLEVALYRTPNPRAAEQSFRWDARRPLTWEDFKGSVRVGSAARTAAETNCGIAVETNLVVSGGRAKVYVFNTFDKAASWVRRGQEQPGVLEHEQGHWDICELYTRRMQARFDAAEITGANLNRKVNEIYNAVSREYIDRQEQYERETQHGVLRDEQQRWSRLIAEELGVEMSGKL